jgi:hypothetical protein
MMRSFALFTSSPSSRDNPADKWTAPPVIRQGEIDCRMDSNKHRYPERPSVRRVRPRCPRPRSPPSSALGASRPARARCRPAASVRRVRHRPGRSRRRRRVGGRRATRVPRQCRAVPAGPVVLTCPVMLE